MENEYSGSMDGDDGSSPRSRAIVLLSGGLDSTTAAYMARERGLELHGLTVRYGQRHDRELEAARAIGEALGLEDHIFSRLDLSGPGSSLTDQRREIPKGRDTDTDIREGGIPSTYVPARNLMFLSLAAHWAEVIDAGYIYTGFNAIDYSGYPDCSPEFVRAFQEVLEIGTRTGREASAPSIEAPLVDLTKAEIIREGTRIDVPYSLTWSCYAGGERACGRCDSCRLRLKGFREAGVEDPLPYVHR